MAARPPILLAAMCLGACSEPDRSTTQARQLVGAWAYRDLQPVGATSPPQGGCGTDFGTTFAADGTYGGYQEAGTWYVEGPYLVTTTTEEIGDLGDLVPVKMPKPTRSRLEWRSVNVVNLRGGTPGEEEGSLVRCADPTR